MSVGVYRIYRCSECTGGYISPLPASSDIGGIYGDGYGEDYMESLMHGESFAEARFRGVMEVIRSWNRRLLALTPRWALDVGCGSGHLLALLRKAGWETRGVELSPSLAKYAVQELGLDVRQEEFTAADLPPEHFHLVSMFHVIEHFNDPITAVRKAFGLLAPGGALFVETPNWEGIGALLRGRRWSHYIPPEHLVYLGPRSIKRLAESCGFTTVICRTTTPIVLQSLETLPRAARKLGIIAYRLASLIGRGPSLQYMGARL